MDLIRFSGVLNLKNKTLGVLCFGPATLLGVHSYGTTNTPYESDQFHLQASLTATRSKQIQVRGPKYNKTKLYTSSAAT